MKLQHLIENHWYNRINLWLTLILLPLSILFSIVSRIRYLLYKFKIFKSYKLPIPLIVVGNITVGGVGKTPLTKYLATELSKEGIKVGVVLRGYKSKIKHPHIVSPTDTSEMVGDEALIYAQNNIKVAISRKRYLAALKLLKSFPDIELIISDDGLQHYSLISDYKIAVIDATRMFGNKFLLPMGPLREKINSLCNVDAIVINGNITLQENFLNNIKLINPKITISQQNLIIDKIFNPVTKEIVNINMINNFNTIAIAAIGNPNRFFDFLINYGIKLNRKIAFPDHYDFKINDIPKEYEAILVTEKDYVKLAKFNNAKIWVILIKVELDNQEIIYQIKNLKDKSHG